MITLPKTGLTQLVSDWKIAGRIPDVNGMKTSYGLAGPVAGMHHGKLIIGGGANFPDSMPWTGGKKMYYRELFVFETKENGEYFLKSSSRLPFTLAYPAVASGDAGILVCGGENENGISSKCFLLRWDEMQQNVLVQSLPDLPAGLTNGSAVINGSVVYVAGGEGKNCIADALYTLNLTNLSAGWRRKAPVPHSVSHAVAIYRRDNNSIYLIGGRRKESNGISNLYKEVFMYNVSSDQWIQRSSLPYPLSAGTGIDAGLGQLLVFGGDKGSVFHETEMLLKEIGETKDQETLSKLNQRKADIQSSHPGFSREILRYDGDKDVWVTDSVFPFPTPVTTTALVNGQQIILPSGEIRAGVRTPVIVTGKLKTRLTGTVR